MENEKLEVLAAELGLDLDFLESDTLEFNIWLDNPFEIFDKKCICLSSFEKLDKNFVEKLEEVLLILKPHSKLVIHLMVEKSNIKFNSDYIVKCINRYFCTRGEIAFENFQKSHFEYDLRTFRNSFILAHTSYNFVFQRAF